MDPAQGESQGKSLTSKLKAKVKGVKGKVHLPGHKKRQAGDAQGNDDSSSSDYDDSPRKPGPETGYNLGASTPYTTVNNTPLSPERSPPHQTHNRNFTPTSAPSSAPSLEKNSSSTEGVQGYSEPPSSPSQPSPGMLGQVRQTVGGAAAAVGSRIGYYSEVEGTPHVQAPTDPNAPSVMEKTKAALGMDKPTDPNAPTLMEKTKGTLGLNKPSDPNAPTMMEKTKAALGMDKPADPNAPTMMEKTKASLGLGPSSPNAAASQQQPGIVDRVSGAVSSMFNGSPKETGADVQHTFPAHSDDVPKAQDRGVENARMPTSTPTYNSTLN